MLVRYADSAIRGKIIDADQSCIVSSHQPALDLSGSGPSEIHQFFQTMPPVELQTPFECPAILEGLKVLVVEDEPDSRQLLTTILEKCKAIVTAVASVPDAIDVLKNSRHDVLVSDVEMPGEDGYSLIRKVRENETGKLDRMPAAALTAHARVSDRMKALRAGFDIHVPKPVEPAEFLAVMASLASRIQDRPQECSENKKGSDSDSLSALTGKKILLVEDDMLSTEVLQLGLKRQGCDVRTAQDVSSAFDILRDWLPDIIVSDLGLPGEDGFALIKKIRSGPEGATIFAVALTGFGPEEGARAVSAGFNLYKSKPIDSETLISELVDLTKSNKSKVRQAHIPDGSG